MQLVDLSQILQNVKSSQFIIIDKTIVGLYRGLREALVDKSVFYLHDPEAQKSFNELEKALNFFLSERISRDDQIIVIGGGATSDFGGFVAATLLRGISWQVYPTTLLAMVDASIGGKVSINTDFGKNLVGAFHLPDEVYICHEFLSTLPKEELISGQGEVIKYAFLSKEIYKLIMDKESIKLIIRECAKFKEDIVDSDFKESGKRKILNLGHTFGHAIEKSIGIPHGIAVIIGMKLIIDIFSPSLKEDLKNILKEFDFNFDLPCVDFTEFENYLKSDKKSKNDGTLDLIIPKSIGNVEIKNLPFSEILTKIKEYSEYETFFK